MKQRHVEPLEHRAAHGGLSGADVAGQDDDAFLAVDGLEQQLEGRVVRLTQEQESRVRREREG